LFSIYYYGTRSTVSLLTVITLNGVTHLSMDIQLMDLRFLELVILNLLSCFPRYVEQVNGLRHVFVC
jgi:hypothetical protein